MCACTPAFRPTLLSMTELNDCTRCDGRGWVEEHEYEGTDEECTICGWGYIGHWHKGDER